MKFLSQSRKAPVRSSLLASTSVGVTTLALLAGCSLLPHLGTTPTPTPAAQSQREACDALEAQTDAFTSDMNEAGSLLTTDFPAAAELIAHIADDWQAAVDDVDNKKVHDLGAVASDEMNAFSALLDAAAGDPANADSDAIGASGQKVQEAFTELGDLCS